MRLSIKKWLMELTEINLTVSQEELNRVIVVALERLSQAFRTLLWDHAKQEKLSPIQIQFMVFIAAHPDRQSRVTDIAREFNLTPATVSDAVKSLENKGYIRKKANENDRRVQWLQLTSSGKSVTRNLSGWQATIIEHLDQFPLQTKRMVIMFLLELVESLRRDHVLQEVKTCLSCGYFQRDVNDESDSPHFCLLREVPMENLDLRLDCPNYQKKLKT